MATRRYEQRLRAEEAEWTRRRILDALHERLREASAEPVSVDQIARMAREARSTVYLVFGSRPGCSARSAPTPRRSAGPCGSSKRDGRSGAASRARLLADQGALRPDVTDAQAADVLWLLTSFDARYTGRSLPAEQVADTLRTALASWARMVRSTCSRMRGRRRTRSGSMAHSFLSCRDELHDQLIGNTSGKFTRANVTDPRAVKRWQREGYSLK